MNESPAPPSPSSPAPRPRRRLLAAFVRPLLAVTAIAAVFWFTGCMERLFYYPTRGPTPAPRQFPRTEGVGFNSADGTRLYGWFIPASSPGTNPATAPTILHVHGNAGNIESHIDFTSMLPPAGFNLFIFDFRGYGQSEGSATRRGKLIEDTTAALDYLLRRDDIDRTRIGLYGQSLGGAIALNVMADRPEIRAAVIESPFASWRGMGASALGGDPPSFLGRIVAAILIGDGHSPLQAIGRIDRPVLILHGDADTIIPVGHSRRLKAAAGTNVELVELQGGDHNSLRLSHPEGDALMIEFYRRHLQTQLHPE